MPSIRTRLLNLILRYTVKRRLAKVALTPDEIARTRSRLDRMGRAGGARKDAEVRHTLAELGGVKLNWTEPAGPARGARPIVLHMHGGAYFVGSSDAYRPFAANLALATDARVGVLDYALAPESPYPAAPNDAFAAYKALLQQGVPAKRIALSGDSAGGNLALVTLLKIKEARLPTPAAGVLLSPWADLTGSGESMVSNARRDPMLPGERMPEAAHLYAGEHDLRDWRISPLFGEYAGLPPLTIHCGSTEILRDDARRVAACAREAGVDVALKEWPRAPHVFPVFADFLPEGKTAIAEIAAWLAALLPDRDAIDHALGPREPLSAAPARDAATGTKS